MPGVSNRFGRLNRARKFDRSILARSSRRDIDSIGSGDFKMSELRAIGRMHSLGVFKGDYDFTSAGDCPFYERSCCEDFFFEDILNREIREAFTVSGEVHIGIWIRLIG